jgi:steroid 5-alpha reductase family enzyme
MVWLGVWLFAFSARGVAALPSIVGFGNIVILFATASIPWLERRQRERRPAYAQYQKEVACLIPYVL